jgi:hypothetical protein
MMREDVPEVPVGLRRKTKSIPRLDLNKKLDIAYKCIINKESQGDLAKEFNVSQAAISNVVIREALDK